MLVFSEILVVLVFFFAYVTSQGAYCINNVGPSQVFDSNVGETRLVGASKTIGDTTNCPGSLGVQDLTAQVADLIPGQTYSLMFTETTCGNIYPTLAGAWIDFNGDKTFSSAEALAPFSPAKGAITIQFTVPTTDNKTSPSLPGASRLRVQVQETYQTFIDPCGAFSYGGTKDFGIIILPPGAGGLSGKVSGGTIFLVVLLLLVFLYILIGASFNKFKKGTVGVRETCPHSEFWLNFVGYVRDGFLFTKSKCRRKGDDIAVYDSIDSNDI